jgi:hypothetical protein
MRQLWLSHDSIRIALTMAALNDLQVKVGDMIQNAYLTAPRRERRVTVCGPEFGKNQGQTTMLVCALNGLKSYGAAFRNQHLAACIQDVRLLYVLRGRSRCLVNAS